jgi:hypothetical protein
MLGPATRRAARAHGGKEMIARVAVLLVLLALETGPAAAQSSTGKQAAFASANGVTLNDGDTGVAPLLTVELLKGKKRSAVAVEGAMQVDVSSPSLPSLEVHVNGVPANGPTVAVDCKYVAVQRCTLAGSWWLDLDVAEGANPGVFVGKPLTVELIGGANTYSPPISGIADVTLTARLVKK